MIAEELIKIFENLGFKSIIENKQKLIIMSPEDAFVFSSITGAKYLSYINGVTMKGRFEVFIHRSIFSNNHLIYSPGLFSRDINGNLIEGNSSYFIENKFPYVYTNEKKIIIEDLNISTPSNIESYVYTKLISNKCNPSDYILYKNKPTNNIGESLLEYFASIYFINQGYLVENQVPWFQQNYKYNGATLQGGIPDFSAFHSSISDELFKLGVISENKGISINILPVLRLFKKQLKSNKKSFNYSHELLIGEAKTSKSSLKQANTQLDKYSKVQIANKLFTILPEPPSTQIYDSFCINNYLPAYYTSKTKISKRKNIDEDENWINTYVKMLLLGNVQFSDIIKFINSYRKNNHLQIYDNYQSYHLLDAVQNTSSTDIIKLLKGVI